MAVVHQEVGVNMLRRDLVHTAAGGGSLAPHLPVSSKDLLTSHR